VAQSETLTLNKSTTHTDHVTATSAGGTITTYDLTYQSFASSDFHFSFSSSTGDWSITGTGSDAHVSFQFVAYDNYGQASNTGTITIYFR
jgi:hypothetical protein